MLMNFGVDVKLNLLMHVFLTKFHLIIKLLHRSIFQYKQRHKLISQEFRAFQNLRHRSSQTFDQWPFRVLGHTHTAGLLSEACKPHAILLPAEICCASPVVSKLIPHTLPAHINLWIFEVYINRNFTCIEVDKNLIQFLLNGFRDRMFSQCDLIAAGIHQRIVIDRWFVRESSRFIWDLNPVVANKFWDFHEQ